MSPRFENGSLSHSLHTIVKFHGVSFLHYWPSWQRTGLILGLSPSNERQRYFITMSLIGWVQAWNQPWRSNLSGRHGNWVCSGNWTVTWKQIHNNKLQTIYYPSWCSKQISPAEVVLSACLMPLSPGYLAGILSGQISKLDLWGV